MMLKNKVAVIYGPGGGIGSAVARAFEREAAKLFLTGRHRAPVEVVAKEIVSAGGSAEAAEVDALDEQAADTHLQSVIDNAGRVDISFNAIGIPNPKIRVPLVELDVEQFSLPIATYTRSYFLTARLAARRMVANRSGVIMTLTSTPSRTGTPLVGGGGPAMGGAEPDGRAQGERQGSKDGTRRGAPAKEASPPTVKRLRRVSSAPCCNWIEKGLSYRK
jgi:NAD(P)-dependent dehydrogenase (short-subunit alcohol dehydrogenase family)